MLASTSRSSVLRSACSCVPSIAASRPLVTATSRVALPRRRQLSHRALPVRRSYATEAKEPIDEAAEDAFDLENVERAQDETDVLIIGGGPAGLSAAIRIKQRANEEGKDLRVVLLEKASNVGNHILSGAVIETRSLEELFPDWKERGAPLHQPALKDRMRWLTKTSSYPMPHPPQMNNKGNYIISLSKLTRWLGEQAEELGVEVYSGFAGSKLVLNEDKTGIAGVVTNEVGLDKSHKPKSTFEPGMEFRAKATLFAEGCHGSLSKQLIQRFNLREGKDPQTYGLGIKEVWRVKEDKHEPGTVVHTLGWPLNSQTYGGSWLYHMEDRMVSLGLVVGLDYANPYISPFREFQRMKHHPFFADLLEGGECLAYGARALNEGGYQSIPKLTVPGAALIGDSAGFLNVPKIKGTHTSMQSGIQAADTVFDALTGESEVGEVADLSEYQTRMDKSWVLKELKEVRNLRPSFHTFGGNYGGILYSGLDAYVLKGRTPWTFHHPSTDAAATKPADQFSPIDYPSPDGTLSFDILTSVARTGTNHAEDQPVHLVVKDGDYARHVQQNAPFAGLLNKACPAGVYEYINTDEDGGEPHDGNTRFVINSQNCIHCKTCDIKVPSQDITWQPPEGGGGPAYSLT